MNKCDEAAPTRGAGTVAAEGGVVGERAEKGVGGEFGFLDACNQDRLGVEEGGNF